MSTALIAVMPMPLRPKAMVLRYMCCHRNSMSHGSAPSRSGLRCRSITCLVTNGGRAALPIPTSPSSLITSTTSQLWKVKVLMEDDCGSESKSIGLVPKCVDRGVVFLDHCATLVRTSRIFMMKPVSPVPEICLLLVDAMRLKLKGGWQRLPREDF